MVWYFGNILITIKLMNMKFSYGAKAYLVKLPTGEFVIIPIDPIFADFFISSVFRV